MQTSHLATWVRRWRPELVFAASLTIGRELLATRIGFDASDLFMIAGLGTLTVPGPRDVLARRIAVSRRRRR
jgi:hypothetical protein